MPRDVNGNYTLPSGNPVVTNTLISSIWANTTLSDVATALSNSLDRTGASSGMTGQLKATDGAVGAPGYSFNSEPASGLYRAGAADFRFSVAATDVVKIGAFGVSSLIYRAGDGLIGAPAYSWTNDTVSGLYRAAANDYRYSINSIDVVRIQPLSVIITGALSAQSLSPTSSTAPTAGIYLPGANQIGFTTASNLRGSIDSSGNLNWLKQITSVVSGGGPTASFFSSSTLPALAFQVTSGAADSKNWDVVCNGTGLLVRILNDAASAVKVAIDIERSANVLQSLTFGNATDSPLVSAYDQAGNLWNLGWRDTPQNTQNTSYTFVLADRGKQVFFNGAAGQTYTIPANASIAFPIGTVIVIVNFTAVNLSIAITSDNLFLAGTALSGTRTLGAVSMCTITKVATTSWYIAGPGVS